MVTVTNMYFVNAVHRLEAYDRNFNFGNNASLATDDYKMTLPDPETYKDINTDSQVMYNMSL